MQGKTPDKQFQIEVMTLNGSSDVINTEIAEYGSDLPSLITDYEKACTQAAAATRKDSFPRRVTLVQTIAVARFDQ